MKNTFKKLAAMALAAVMMVAVSVPAFAATTTEVNITTYKSGTTDASMAQAALTTGTIIYDEDSNETYVEFSVAPIEKYGMVGYLTAFSIDGINLVGTDLDGDDYADVFSETFEGKLELDKVYSASIDMVASGYVHSGYGLDIVFSAVE